MLWERKAFVRLELIWPISRLKIFKMSKNVYSLHTGFGSQWFNFNLNHINFFSSWGRLRVLDVQNNCICIFLCFCPSQFHLCQLYSFSQWFRFCGCYFNTYTHKKTLTLFIGQKGGDKDNGGKCHARSPWRGAYNYIIILLLLMWCDCCLPII